MMAALNLPTVNDQHPQTWDATALLHPPTQRSHPRTTQTPKRRKLIPSINPARPLKCSHKAEK